MSQSSKIAFALLIGFIVYITVRGELPAYLCVIGLGSGCTAPPVNTQNSGTSNPSPTMSPVSSTITAPPIGGPPAGPVNTGILTTVFGMPTTNVPTTLPNLPDFCSPQGLGYGTPQCEQVTSTLIDSPQPVLDPCDPNNPNFNYDQCGGNGLLP